MTIDDLKLEFLLIVVGPVAFDDESRLKNELKDLFLFKALAVL